MNDSLAASLTYARRGWHVFPCRPGGKEPATRHGFKDASSDPDQIRRWWGTHPQLNVGIRTGAVSGLVIIDIDPRNGGEQSLRRLVDEYGPIPRTVKSRTGGGGLHLYFKHPGGFSGSPTGLWPGLDVRGDNAYVIAPPSRLKGGQLYEWLISPDQHGLTPLPEWLSVRLRKASSVPRKTTHRQLVELEGVGVPEGSRNASLARLVGRWVTQGYDDEAVARKASAWNERNQPPMTEREVVLVTDKIIARARKRDPAETIISVLVAADRRLTPRDHSLLVGLVAFWRRLGLSSLTFIAPYALLARYAPVRSRRAIRGSLLALQEAELIRVAKAVSPNGREITQITFIGKIAAVLEGDL